MQIQDPSAFSYLDGHLLFNAGPTSKLVAVNTHLIDSQEFLKSLIDQMVESDRSPSLNWNALLDYFGELKRIKENEWIFAHPTLPNFSGKYGLEQMKSYIEVLSSALRREWRYQRQSPDYSCYKLTIRFDEKYKCEVEEIRKQNWIEITNSPWFDISLYA